MIKTHMDTKEVKELYNTTLKASRNPYEEERWFKSPQRRAGYASTRSAVEQYALPHLQDGTNIQVFELGPGPGTWTKLLLQKAPAAHFDLVDISEEMLKQAAAALATHQNVNFIVSDILDFVPARQYDYFFSSRIIEYVPDKDKAVQIIAESLKSGAYGYIVTKTPQKRRPFGKPVTTPLHMQQVAALELARLFESHGCSVIRKVNVTCVFPGLRSSIADRVLSRVCRFLPFAAGHLVSESYALVFKKK